MSPVRSKPATSSDAWSEPRVPDTELAEPDPVREPKHWRVNSVEMAWRGRDGQIEPLLERLLPGQNHAAERGKELVGPARHQRVRWPSKHELDPWIGLH